MSASFSASSCRYLLMLLLLSCAGTLHADPCGPDEVLVGEDAHNYYCKDRQQFAQCIRRSGVFLQRDNQSCSGVWARCMLKGGQALSDAQQQCLTSCALDKALTGAGAGRASACLVTCGVVAGVWSIPQYMTRCSEVMDSCNTEALERHKASRQACIDEE